MPKLLLSDESVTVALASELGATLVAGDLIFLHGELGAGKTTFVRALARALGVGEEVAVISPTFAIVQEYPEAEPYLVHGDLYRLGHPEELRELGLEEALEDAVVVLEWAQTFREELPPPALEIQLAFPDSETDSDRARVATLTLGAGAQRSALRAWVDRWSARALASVPSP